MKHIHIKILFDLVRSGQNIPISLGGKVSLGQVQNDFLYIRYKSSSTQDKSEECKELIITHNTLLFCCYIYSINFASLSQG